MADDDELLREAKELFQRDSDADRDNRAEAEDDIRFSRMEEQWSESDKKRREEQGRPCLTINRLAPVIRQVVNDSRQNRPAIKVMPQDSNADVETADVMSGLIRNIETSSDADIAYDTAVEHAVTSGRGYFRINLAYACEDNWDQDIVFERISNPLSVIGDTDATAADGSDWKRCFITEMVTKDEFKARYPGKDPIEWEGVEGDAEPGWRDGDEIRICEYWTREEVKKTIVLLSDGQVVDQKTIEDHAEEFLASGLTIQGPPRSVTGYKVTQRIITGAQVLETNEWAGKYIPIIPVYGDEVNLGGRRYFRSLIRSAKDAQRLYNYEKSVAAELGALAPKVPFIGPKGAFESDLDKWQEIHTTNHPFVEYDGAIRPERQPSPMVNGQQMENALSAADDIRAVTGIHEASLGEPSNEKSGRAILARQREGDVSTFHFIDNLSRSIRHAGRVLIDLIPKVYAQERVVRVLGEQGEAKNVPLGQPVPVEGPDGQPQIDPNTQAPATRIYDLTAGKYDLTVRAGPSFSTRREEAANQMIEFMQAYPPAASVIGPQLAKNLDWPGADEIAQKLEQMTGGGGVDPAQVQQMQAQMQQTQQELQVSQQEIQSMKADTALQARKLEIDAFNAETNRIKAVADLEQAKNPPIPAQRWAS